MQIMNRGWKNTLSAILCLFMLIGLVTISNPREVLASTGDVVIQNYQDVTVPMYSPNVFSTTTYYISAYGNAKAVYYDRTPNITLSNIQMVQGSDGNYYLTFSYLLNSYSTEGDWNSGGTYSAYYGGTLTYFVNGTQITQRYPNQNSDYGRVSWGAQPTNSGRVLLGSTKPTSNPTLSFTEGVSLNYYYNNAYALAINSTLTMASSVTLTQALSAPTSVTASNVTNSSAVLNWNSVSGATSYNIYNGSTLLASNITTTNYTLTSLTSNTSYNLSVTGVNSSSESPKSTPVSVTTLSSPVTNLTVSQITPNSLTLNWSGGSGSSINVYENGTKIASSLPITSTSYNVTGLSPGTTYNFAVTTMNSASTESSQTTVSGTTTSITPTNLTATNVTSNSVDLTWNAVSNASSYNIYNGTTILQSNVTNTTNYTLSGLNRSTSYALSVTAIVSGNESSQSNVVNVTTNAAATVNPPIVSIAIDNGASQTTSTNASLQIAASSSFYAATDLTMSFSTDGSTWTTPEAFATTKSWTLPSTPGNDPIFVRVTDPSGNAGIAYASIQYVSQTSSSIGGSSTQGATIGGNYPSITYNGISNVYVTQSNSVSLDLTAYTGMFASVSTDNISYSDLFSCDTPINVTLPSGDGLKTVYVRLASSNNKAALGPVGYIYFLVDTTAPTLNVTAVGNATVTTGTSFQVQLDATDNTTPLSALQCQVNGGSWSTVPSNQVISLSGFQQHSGLQTYQITVRDLAGNIVTKAITFWTV